MLTVWSVVIGAIVGIGIGLFWSRFGGAIIDGLLDRLVGDDHD